MKPGDMLYLPRGQYHDALTGAQASLHVTFGVSPATGLAMFKLLETAVTQESAFRAYLPDARNAAELRDRLAQLADRVRTVITSPAFAVDLLNHQRGLASAPAIYDLARTACRRPGTRSRAVRRSSGATAATSPSLDGGEIALGATYPTVEWILKQRMFSLDDALARYSSVDPAELRAVLAKLIAAGVLVETEMRTDAR